jgi:putative addiction module CopG family antidote
MHVALKPKLRKFVEDQVNAGRYQKADDMVAAALTRLMQDDGDDAFGLGELSALVQEGESDIARGDTLTLEQVRPRRTTDCI